MSASRHEFNYTLYNDSAVQYDPSRASTAIRMGGLDVYSIIASWTTEAARTAKTWDAAKTAAVTISDLTYTADAAGAAGNSITIEYLDSVKASRVVQDITYTADAKGSAGNNIRVAYVTGGFGGQESAARTGAGTSGDPYVCTATIQGAGAYGMPSGVAGTRGTLVVQDLTHTANVRGEYVSVAYVTGGFGGEESSARTGAGTVGNPYVVTVTIQGANEYPAKTCVGGTRSSVVIQDLTYHSDVRTAASNYIQIDYTAGGTAGAESVAVTGVGTAVDPYIITVTIESGVSTATQIETAINATGAATALVDVTVSGTGGTAQTTISATPLTGGVDSGINASTDVITSVAHGFVDGVRIQVSSTGTLPGGLSASTDYWVNKLSDDTFELCASYADVGTGTQVNLTNQGAESATITFTSFGSTATEIDAAIAADGDSNTTLSTAVTGTGGNAQNLFAVAPLTGNVASIIDTTADTITIASHGLVNGVRLQVSTSTGSVPGGLAASTDYWVVGVSGSSFQLAAAYGGGAINLTDQGTESATFTFTPRASTATEVKAAIDASGDCAAVVDATITGTGSNQQALASVVALAGGLGGAAGAEEVVVASTAIKVYIEDGVSTADQVKAAVNLVSAATALVDITGTGATAQAVTAATPLTGGVASELNLTTGALTIPTHGLVTGIEGQLTTTGTLPTGLATSTNYWAIYVDANTIKLASSYDNAVAGTAIIPTDDGGENSVNTFTPTALSGSIQLKVTNDDPASSSASWVNFGSATSISGDSSVTLVGPAGTSFPVAFPFRGLRMDVTATGGGIALSAKFHGRSIS